MAELAAASFEVQVNSAIADSLGLCVFGRTVNDTNRELIATAINDAHDAGIDAEFVRTLGLETLRYEQAFNEAAGFTEADDELPTFFHENPLPPTDKVARLQSREVHACLDEIWKREAV